MKIVPANITNLAANQVTTGTQVPKPALNNAQVPINTPVPAPVIPAAPAKPAMENINPAPAPAAMNGKTMFAKKNPNPNGANATARPKTATLVIFCIATEPAALKEFPARSPSPSSSTKAPTAIVDKLWR